MNETPIAFLRQPGDANKRASTMTAYRSANASTPQKVMSKGIAHLLGLVSVVAAALLRPGPVVRWLSRRFPDVLFEQPNAGPLVALTFDDSPHATRRRASWMSWPRMTPALPFS